MLGYGLMILTHDIRTLGYGIVAAGYHITMSEV